MSVPDAASVGRGFEFVDHTADVGIRAWAPDLAGAFAEAAVGLSAYMVDVSRARGTGEVRVVLEADSAERLLVQFLEELLFRHQRDLVIFTSARVALSRAAGAWRLEADVEGEPWDEPRHGHVHEVKAITFHGIRVEAGPPAEVLVVVDI